MQFWRAEDLSRGTGECACLEIDCKIRYFITVGATRHTYAYLNYRVSLHCTRASAPPRRVAQLFVYTSYRRFKDARTNDFFSTFFFRTSCVVIIHSFVNFWRVNSIVEQWPFESITVLKTHAHRITRTYTDGADSDRNVRLELTIFSLGRGIFLHTGRFLNGNINFNIDGNEMSGGQVVFVRT